MGFFIRRLKVRDLMILERFAGEWKARPQADHGLTVDEGMALRLASWDEHILYLLFYSYSQTFQF